MELNDEDKARILLEERYRAEVRAQVAEDKPVSGWGAFLNSSFGLWLLSAIFISGAGTLYQRWQKEADRQRVVFQKTLQEEASRRDAVSRLDVEISYRLSSVLIQLAHVEERIDAQFVAKSKDDRRLQAGSVAFSVLGSLNNRENAGRDGLYPEFANFTLSTLLAELRRRLPQEERPEVEASLASLASLSKYTNFGNDGTAPAEAAAAELFSKVILKRWQGTAFHYIDCNVQKPFC
jgi:hypothetical protein